MAAKEFHCEVKSFRMVTPTVFEIGFEPHPSLDYQAGQFLSIVIPGAGPKGRDLRRAYSIASCPEVHPVEVCIKIVDGGPGTSYLSKLRPGDEFKAYAPYGDFVYEGKANRHVCFIATGTGVAPFRAMLTSESFQKDLPSSTLCLAGVRSEVEVLYREDFEKLKFAKWVPCVSRPTPGKWDGFSGRVTDYLKQNAQTIPWADTEFYLCGAGAMIDEVKQLLLEKSVSKESIHQEIYYKQPKSGTE